MKEILLTSSVLILALLALRRVFRKRISRRLQYALWGLVLLRLLIPANLPAADFSVLSAAAPVVGEADDQILYIRPTRQTVSAPEGTDPLLVVPSGSRFAAMGPPSADNTRTVTDENRVTRQTEYERQIDLGALCRPVWYGGMAVMALWLAASNLGFWGKLRRKRIPLELPECRYPVYLVEEGLVSPCLFGLFRPAIYLNPAAMETKDGLRHVLAHEETHGRQFDPLWSLLRSVCLTVYWFDPLVWRAAAASKEDCELACDEGVLKRLGEGERIPYGRTLLRLIPVRRRVGGALVTATTMTSDKKRLKERITRIAENRKMKTAALCAALAVTAAVCAVTFTGYASAEGPADVPDAPAAAGDDAAEPPALPDNREAGLPSGEPALTIPLTELTPRGLLPVETIPVDELFDHHHNGHHGEYVERHFVGGGCETTEGYGTFAWCHEGSIYVSSHNLFMSSFPSDYFLSFPEQEYAEEKFTNVLGHDGVVISYIQMLGSNGTEVFNDYYIFEETESGTSVYLLARVYGEPQLIDLDGDGTCELVSTDGWQQAQIYFQRGGEIYEANLPELLTEHWKRWDEKTWLSGSYDFYGWDPDGRYLSFSGYVPAVRDDGMETSLIAQRQLIFDSENLLLYKPERKTANHVLSGIQAPDAVIDAASELAKSCYEQWVSGYGEGWSDTDIALPEWDDYCVTGIQRLYPEIPGGIKLEVYNVSCEFHSTPPAHVVQAGGTCVYEDGWVGGFWMDATSILVFQILEDGSYKQLECNIPWGFLPGSDDFDEAFHQILADNSLLS